MGSNKKLKWTGERLTSDKKGETVIQHLHRYAIAVELSKNKVVLDIASGEGYGSNFLAQVAEKVIGVDIDKEVIQFSQQKYKSGNLFFLEGSADKIPIADNSVDIVVSFETIEHHNKHEEMFNEIKRVLKPDGILIMSSPDKLNFSILPRITIPFHIKELYREEFKELVNKHFTYNKIYYQHVMYNSIIVPEDGIGVNFNEYSGEFDKIKSNQTISSPTFNLCIASNHELKNTLNADISIFNATDILNNILSKENEIYNSITYKIGYFITFPVRLIRKVFN